MKTPVLSSKRLTLGAITTLDAEPIFEYCQDPDIQRFTRVPVPFERSHAEQFTSGVEATDSSCVWAIRENSALVGTVGLRFIAPGTAECGYWIGRPFRGRGLMTEALGTVVDHAFDGFGLDRVVWEAAVANIASAVVARRIGFRFDGTEPLGLELRGEHFDAWRASLHRSDDRTAKDGWPL